MSQYKVGTASVTNGSQTVTGSGTSWLSEVSAGDYFVVQYVQGSVEDGGVAYEIGGVVSNTELTLTTNYAGQTRSDIGYVVHRDFVTVSGLNIPKFFPGDVESAAILNKFVVQIANRYSQGTESNLGTLKISALAAALAGTDENTAMPPDLVHAAFNQYGLGRNTFTAVADLDAISKSGLYYSKNGITANLPTTSSGTVLHQVSDITDFMTQLFIALGSGVEDGKNIVYVRHKDDGVWENWIRIDPQAFGLGTEIPPRFPDANDIAKPGFYGLASGATGNVTAGAATVIQGQYDGGSRNQLQIRAGNTTEIEAFLVNFLTVGQQAHAEIYHERNILGTVSESGGVPTGAIIERGSNANGEYVKFADGTVIFIKVVTASVTMTTASGNMFVGSTTTGIDFPISVISGSAKLTGFINDSAGTAIGKFFYKTATPTTTDAVAYYFISTVSATESIRFTITGQARWF